MVRIFEGDCVRAIFNDLKKLPEPFELQSLQGKFSQDVRILLRSKPRDFLQVGAFIFVSEKARTILNDHDADVETFPVTVAYKKEDRLGWYYLNLLKRVDCLDPEKTVRAGPADPFPERVKYMVLRETECANIAIFRIATTIDIGLSEKLAQAFQRAKCTGAVFKKPEDWRNPALYYGS